MPSPLPPSPDAEAARERVVRLLTDRYADGTLTVEAFEAELDRMHATADSAELARMAEALTSGVWRGAAALPAAAPPPARPAPAELGWQRGALVPARIPQEGRVLAVMSSTTRAGPWAVPRTLRVRAVMSEAVVDLRDAVIPAEGCEVELGALMANVKVLLPPGVEALVEVSAFLGQAKDDARAPVGAAGPRVRVTGTAVMAEVTVFGA